MVLFPSWMYRIVVPPDPGLLAARGKYFEEAYDHLNFWSTVRLAEEAERQYFTSVGNKRHEDENPVGPSAFM